MQVLYRGAADFPLDNDETRAKGVHLTDVLHYIADVTNMFSGPPVPEHVTRLKMAMGRAWENYVDPFLERQYDTVRPGEFYLDGIWGTPDGISPHEDTELVDEIKLSYYSSAQPFDGKGWLLRKWQAVGYLKMTGLNIARYWILSVCGDYKPSNQPHWEQVIVEYTQDEIDRNWQMILANRDKMLEAQQAKEA